MKAFILQARVGSTRLPNKILRDFFNGLSILDIVVNKLKTITPNIILATSTNPENDELETYAKEHGLMCYRGSEEDVLSRFIDAAICFNIDKIIRVCSDNPFLDVIEAKKIYNEIDITEMDYISFSINNTPSIKTHYGFWTEFVTLETLKTVSKVTAEKFYHEHVTNYIYENPDKFKIKWLSPSLTLEPGIRLTIDTVDDFRIARFILEQLYVDSEVFKFPSTQMVLNFLKDKPNLVKMMKQQISNNSK